MSQNWSQSVDVLRNQVPSQLNPFIAVRKTFHLRSLAQLDDTFGHVDRKNQKRNKLLRIQLIWSSKSADSRIDRASLLFAVPGKSAILVTHPKILSDPEKQVVNVG